MATAIERLQSATVPVTLVGYAVELWLEPRVAKVLEKARISMLADLALRAPRRRRWSVCIDSLGATGARCIATFFAAHQGLTDRARSLVVGAAPEDVVPWERIVVPHDIERTTGLNRASRASYVLRANNYCEAVQAWLSLHEVLATFRPYHTDAERLMLWATMQR